MIKSLFFNTEISRRIISAKRIWLFLDYDGTLADFSPTPDSIIQDKDLISLLEHLSTIPKIRVSIISGRRLEHIKKLLPIENIDLAGTYGIEIKLFDGKSITRADLKLIRPSLDKIKPLWSRLIRYEKGYYLEDKGWSLALHAQYAAPEKINNILLEARSIALSNIPDNLFKILGGDKFLEIAPLLADKAKTVNYLLDLFPNPEAFPIYLGDDDKDEEAFNVILSKGGLPILISQKSRKTSAFLRLNSPTEARQCLANLMDLVI